MRRRKQDKHNPFSSVHSASSKAPFFHHQCGLKLLSGSRWKGSAICCRLLEGHNAAAGCCCGGRCRASEAGSERPPTTSPADGPHCRQGGSVASLRGMPSNDDPRGRGDATM